MAQLMRQRHRPSAAGHPDDLEVSMRTTSTLRAALLATLAAATFSTHADTFRNGESFYGTPTVATTYARQVTLGSRATMNVDYDSVVTFTNEGRSFTWQFNGLDHRPVDITKIAPAGFPTKPLIIYVAPDPFNRG
mmetsp:Transcript_16935/g.31861  ORF Transcript_16935/g.31861 Transcript_16935/m.31861 type:complete len:135 (+) Transcript_16935:193-597(+)